MDTTPDSPDTAMRAVRVRTIDGTITIITSVRSQHTRGVIEHRYPLTLHTAAMLSAELNNEVHAMYARTRGGAA